MRQTSKRARRSRLLMIFILVLLIALVLWGLAALADRLLHYGANATVSAKDARPAQRHHPDAGDGGRHPEKYIRSRLLLPRRRISPL